LRIRLACPRRSRYLKKCDTIRRLDLPFYLAL
jgi:hypothetical protein